MSAFERAIASEMAAMRERLGPFEVEVTGGREAPQAARPQVDPTGLSARTELAIPAGD